MSEKEESGWLSREDLEFLASKIVERGGLTQHHIRSFERFVDIELPRLFKAISPIEIQADPHPYRLVFERVFVEKPKISEDHYGQQRRERLLYPYEARIRNISYTGRVYVDVVEEYEIRGQRELTFTHERLYVCDLPIMVKSRYCNLHGLDRDQLLALREDPNDPGGYFIINGSERVIMAFEELAPNTILIEKPKRGTGGDYVAKVFSCVLGTRVRNEVRLKRGGQFTVTIPGAIPELPLFVVLRALGMKTDKEIADAITVEGDLRIEILPGLAELKEIPTVQAAIEYIGNRVAPGHAREYRVARAQNLLDNNLLPHLGTKPSDRLKKAYFLAEMASRLLYLRAGRRNPDDKDHYANKRIRLAGDLLAELLRGLLNRLVRDVKYQLEKTTLKRRPESRVELAFRATFLTERIRTAMATGNWGRGRVGVTQVLDRNNRIATISHLRRIQSPMSRMQPHFEARDLHPTHFGRLCPFETPEGTNCGLIKHLALCAEITWGADDREIRRILRQIERWQELEGLPKDDIRIIPVDKLRIWFETASEGERPHVDALLRNIRISFHKVFLNGEFLGYVRNAFKLAEYVKSLRRQGRINHQVNVAVLQGNKLADGTPCYEAYIWTDPGRVRRPLVVVENGKPKLTKEHVEKLKSRELTIDDLIEAGIIEYLDAGEEENAYVALTYEQLTPEHTHLEILHDAFLGACASLIPYINHNQSPRNSQEAAMAKQSIGIPSIDIFIRPESRAHLLTYPQKPIVETFGTRVLRYDEYPCGQNFVVAVLPFEAYNMEDAVIINKSAIDRGLARSFFYRLYEAECRHHVGGQRDEIEKPTPENLRGYRGEQAYRLIEEDGIAYVEAEASGGDVIIGKTSPPRFFEEIRRFGLQQMIRRDSSVAMRPAEKGVVDRVWITESIHGNRIVKVRIRDHRIPEIGDKFASRHGQKGVIGMIYPQEDMPFTESGIVPDLIINPHAFPSRMTVGQFYESMAGKCMTDRVCKHPVTYEELRQELIRMGFQPNGREVMYDGRTGKRYEVEIFIGIVYYQKLHHMVADKIHARARGQVQMLTRQPTQGRARGGGLRFGEMERDALIGHGAAFTLKDRMLDESDRTRILVCENCGSIAWFDVKQQRAICPICKDKAVVATVTVSYAFKLLLQELMSLCIYPKLILKGYG